MDGLDRDYTTALNKLASTLGLKFEELAGFCGGVADGDFGARRLKEFFKAPEVTEMLDRIVSISEEYKSKTLEAEVC